MPKVIEKDGKKTTVFDVTDPKDMEIAEKLAKAQLVANEGGQYKEQFEKEAEIEAKLENASEAEKVFTKMRSKVEGWYEEHGLDAPKIDSEAGLTGAIKNLEQIEKLEQNQQRGGSGYAPLSQEQIHGGTPQKEGYNSQSELIEDLRSRSRLGDAQAEQILGKLLEKTLKGVKENKKGFGQIETPENETEVQRLNRQWRETHSLRKRNRD